MHVAYLVVHVNTWFNVACTLISHFFPVQSSNIIVM